MDSSSDKKECMDSEQMEKWFVRLIAWLQHQLGFVGFVAYRIWSMLHNRIYNYLTYVYVIVWAGVWELVL